MESKGNVVMANFGVGVEVAASVERQPEVVIRNWRIAHTDRGTSHIVGMETEDYGRCSTPIDAIDYASMTAVTRSGRVYQLEGPQGRDPISERVWAFFRTAHGLTEVAQQGAQPS